MGIHKNAEWLSVRIRDLQSFLCVGLDPDISKIPDSYKKSQEPLLDFCKDVVRATESVAVAYKINVAFFERWGSQGYRQLEELVRFLPQNSFVIADAKRADIGNTSSQYAAYYFDRLNVDAVTLHPYMGLDSLEPFLQYKNKWSVILALTSNPGSADLEMQNMMDGSFLFEKVLSLFGRTEYTDQIMFVVGATQAAQMSRIRQNVPDHFLLIPGIGEQGGDLKATIGSLRNNHEGMLINVSRGISYPNGVNTNFESIVEAASTYSEAMKRFFTNELSG
ncbi:MAG: orotidine-5'-phosphate decarboxylase [Saprospiraceae bacterium]